MSDPSPPGPETGSPRRGQATEDEFSVSGQEANNEAHGVNQKLRAGIEQITNIEKYCTELVNENPIKYALLILAASRCRRAKEAIVGHLAPGLEPPKKEPWWNR